MESGKWLKEQLQKLELNLSESEYEYLLDISESVCDQEFAEEIVNDAKLNPKSFVKTFQERLQQNDEKEERVFISVTSDEKSQKAFSDSLKNLEKFKKYLSDVKPDSKVNGSKTEIELSRLLHPDLFEKECPEQHEFNSEIKQNRMNRSTFDGFYFCWKPAEKKEGYMVVKFGDTRKDTKNKTNYRGKDENIIKMCPHGNSNPSSYGNALQKSVLDVLVTKSIAVKIGATESYVVFKSTFQILHRNCSFDSEKGYIKKDEIKQLLNQKINYSGKRFIGYKLAKKLEKEESF